MFEHVVVPLDGTPVAEQALGPAVSLARERGWHLHLATVLKPTYEGPVTAPDETEMLIVGPVDDYMEAVVERARDAGVSGVSATRLTSDNVVEALEGHRKDVGAGLIVMCTHGRGAVERAWLGSVADGLVRTSEAPLLLVRAAPVEGVRDGEIRTDVRFGRILVALDGSHFSRQGLGPAAQLGGRSDAVYVLARIIESPDPSAEVTDERLQKARAIAESKLDLEVQSFAPDGYAVEPVVEFAPSVAQGILDLAKSREADAVVVATHGRGGISRLLLGSVADKVIRGADLPVLVVRPREA